MKKLSTFLDGLLLATNFFFLFSLVYRILTVKENHIGFPVLPMVAPFAFGLTVGILRKARGENNALSRLLVGVGVFGVVFVLAAYFGNVLVPYETWVKRGMPPKPF